MNKMKKITIAIDGYSSTGKSTIAKELAKKLAYVYVDTGAMYRTVALYAMNKKYIGTSFFDTLALIQDLDAITITFKYNKLVGFAEAYLNGVNVEATIRTLEVSSFVSKVASVPEVREKLVAMQKEMGKNKGVVMDGRDIGTVVFPDADLKLFMTASAEKRATRRYDELLLKGEKVSYEDILENVTSRDHEDTTRKDSPLVKATDAIEIDNSDLTKKEQFEKIYQLVQIKMGA